MPYRQDDEQPTAPAPKPDEGLGGKYPKESK